MCSKLISTAGGTCPFAPCTISSGVGEGGTRGEAPIGSGTFFGAKLSPDVSYCISCVGKRSHSAFRADFSSMRFSAVLRARAGATTAAKRRSSSAGAHAVSREPMFFRDTAIAVIVAERGTIPGPPAKPSDPATSSPSGGELLLLSMAGDATARDGGCEGDAACFGLSLPSCPLGSVSEKRCVDAEPGGADFSFSC